MKTQVFLQARMGSKRLPKKVLLKILGKSIVELMCERLRRIKNLDKIVLVTGPLKKNEKLVEEAKKIGIPYFCQSEENVLERFYEASKKYKPTIIIRVTADCPLIDPDLIAKGLRVFLKGGYDIVGNTRVRTYPDGMDFEVFSSKALALSWKEKKSLHPTKYMLQEPKFKVKDIVSSPNLSHVRLTLDYKEDFTVIKTIYEHLYPKNPAFSLKDILDFLVSTPNLLKINQKYITLDYGLGK